MSISNLGYLYFKEYYMDYFENYNEKYRNLGDKEKEKKTQEYYEDKDKKLFKPIDMERVSGTKKIGEDFLYFKTTYPGLLIGSGLIHSIGVKGESKLGFQFDYTTGLPIINGSSVKGAIRSIFDLVDKKNEAVEYLKGIILSENMLENSLKDYELGKYNGKELNGEYFKTLREEIFEGIKEGKNISMYQRDIFYEAVIDIEETKKINEKINKNNDIQILGEDYITPHKEPLKNPNPIKFIKLMPNIVLRFQFDLKDGILTKDEKLLLFHQIILDLGVGAKTNIGYGRFDDKYTKSKIQFKNTKK
ncbi:type III-B CRISPR module RAMP protein Cmr6 [Clostridium brassicae]|uniref:Type III-B CRISPR module RAMP protein Cmr6 n=1 Tax=Clostridium brassicae TaxID=2999072 RepID=A0ABT4D7T9_9CLOT|nr:type III-B CRISPR module RAMP protein Cmr6 [Clostridium brassicae]MCY6958364.1 type III-B CRISPR module RAMP protein Cmr6 [Clostridium brassicae]